MQNYFATGWLAAVPKGRTSEKVRLLKTADGQFAFIKKTNFLKMNSPWDWEMFGNQNFWINGKHPIFVRFVIGANGESRN